MSQIRKIKRKHVQSQPTKQKGRNVMIWMTVIAVVLVIIVAILGFQLLNSESETAAEAANLSETDIVLMSTSNEPVELADLAGNAENGTAFVFFLGLG
jgi:flagellar basal body-associated protein FliL